MTLMLFVLMGAALGGGLLLVLDGVQKRVPDPAKVKSEIKLSAKTQQRFIRAALGFVIAIAITRWPVMAMGVATSGWFSFELFSGKADRANEIARTEAIASWTEMLRDTLAAAHGLEGSIAATADIAPEIIRPEIRAMAVRLEREPLEISLVGLARDLDHPVGDLVVTALSLAAAGSARELSELLSTLADTAREEANLRMRIDAARARSRTSVRVVTLVTVVMAGGLSVFGRNYLAPYSTVTGQLVLMAVLFMWGAGFVIIRRMSVIKSPDRFLVGSATQQDQLRGQST